MFDEQRTINGGTPQAGIVGPGTFLIQKRLTECTEILEVCVQPSDVTTVQLVEGGKQTTSTTIDSSSVPMSALWTLDKNQAWSAPGKHIINDLYIIIGSAVTVQVEVRYKP